MVASPMRAIRAICLLCITIWPLFPQKHPLGPWLLGHGLTAINYLTALSGFNAYLHWQRLDGASAPSQRFYRERILAYACGSMPLLAISVFIAIVRLDLIQLWRLSPVPLFLSFTQLHLSDLMPLASLSYVLGLCWLLVPPIGMLTRRLPPLAAVTAMLTITLITSSLELSFASSAVLSDDTTAVFMHPLFKVPIFISGCFAATLLPVINNIRNRIARGILLDVSTALWFFLLCQPQLSVLGRIRTSELGIWPLMIFCLVYTAEAAVPSVADTPTIPYSASYRILSSEPIRAVLPDMAGPTCALVYRLVLELYPSEYRRETLEGRGLLLYAFFVICLSITYSTYIWNPIANWLRNTDRKYREDYPNIWSYMYEVCVRPHDPA